MKLFQVTVAILIIFLMMSEAYSCTFFYAATDRTALFGSNEDWISAESYVWFCPPTKNEYGRIFFGFELFPGQKEPFSGINDQGLCFDQAMTSDPEDSTMIEYEDEKLYVLKTDQLKVELYPESITRFFLPLANGDFSFTFNKDPTGKITELVVEYEFLGIKIPYQKID